MTSNLQFRLATPEDAEEIRQLIQSAFRAQDSRPNWTGDMELASRFTMNIELVQSAISSETSDILMATDQDGSLMGTVMAMKRGNMARFGWLAIDERHHRGGIGRKVLEHAEDYCQRNWDIAKFGLNALSTRQELIAWYLRRGYVKTGEVSPFPRDAFEGVALPEDLCFIEMEKELNKGQ